MVFLANEIKWELEKIEKALRKETTKLLFNANDLCLSRKLKSQLKKHSELIRIH